MAEAEDVAGDLADGGTGDGGAAARFVVGFDLDMTLIDPRRGVAATYAALSAELGVPIDGDLAASRLGPPLEEELARWLPAGEVAAAAARYRELYAGSGVAGCEPMPGALDAVAAVRAAGGRVVVVTAKYGPNARRCLARVGLEADEVVGSRWAGGKGPALRAAGASVYVGDHVGDVAGARAAGATSVAVTSGPCSAAELRAAGADVVLTSLADLPAWLSGHRRAGRRSRARQRTARQPRADQPDAGQPVASQPDAAHPDAGHPVAAHPDAGHPVAGHPVAGHPVAGQIVAGQPDARLLAERLAELETRLRAFGSVLVAFSGGADSAFLLAAAVRALGPAAVVAGTAVSPSLPAAELAGARAFAESLGVRHLTPPTREMDRDDYRANAADRCYFCKAELTDVLGPLAAEHGLARVLTGTNADDVVAGFRPGIRAAAERGAATPLADAGLTKAQVRAVSRAWGLVTWDKPAAACLSSRVAYGVAITPARLARVERAEAALRAALRGAGFAVRDLRVRDLGDRARVEVDADLAGPLAARPDLLAAVDGFAAVEVDPRGFRSGSMNELLSLPAS